MLPGCTVRRPVTFGILSIRHGLSAQRSSLQSEVFPGPSNLRFGRQKRTAGLGDFIAKGIRQIMLDTGEKAVGKNFSDNAPSWDELEAMVSERGAVFDLSLTQVTHCPT